MKKLIFTLFALAAFSFTGFATEKTFDFTQIDGFNKWNNSYSGRTVEYTEATVTFASASKQTSNISNCPVTKGGNVTVVMNEDYRPITSAVLECAQWSSKTQTISVKYSTDGVNFNSWEGSPKSSNFTLNVEAVPEGTVALQFSFSSTSNQVGIKSLTVNYGAGSKPKTTATVTFDGEENYNVKWGESFTAPTATTNSTASIEYTSSNPNCATVDAETGEVTLVGNGTTTITATVEANDDFTSAHNSYTITVTDKPREEGEFNFVGWEFPGADAVDDSEKPLWTNSYVEHVVKYTEATVTFAAASKQNQTVSDCPVTKNGDITVALNVKGYITSVSAEFEQWSTKAETVTLYTSTDGVNFTETETTTSNFTLPTTEFSATNIVAIRFGFSEASNQIGVKSIKINFTKDASAIESIEAEDGAARFFNLQGVEVANPVSGQLYIRVQGGKATKVLVK